jgi:hypothetical protein
MPGFDARDSFDANQDTNHLSRAEAASPRMADESLRAHSLTEAYFFLMLQACPSCRAGPIKETRVTVEEEHIDTRLCLYCKCTRCAHELAWRFVLDSDSARIQDPPVVNGSPEPSQIIDLVQWLTLFHRIVAEADKARSRSGARRLGYEAMLCLEEALKFYEAENDLPPASAFFTDKHRSYALENPSLFTRQRLLGQRSKLPDLAAATRRIEDPKHRPWWKLW